VYPVAPPLAGGHSIFPCGRGDQDLARSFYESLYPSDILICSAIFHGDASARYTCYPMKLFTENIRPQVMSRITRVDPEFGKGKRKEFVKGSENGSPSRVPGQSFSRASRNEVPQKLRWLRGITV